MTLNGFTCMQAMMDAGKGMISSGQTMRSNGQSMMNSGQGMMSMGQGMTGVKQIKKGRLSMRLFAILALISLVLFVSACGGSAGSSAPAVGAGSGPSGLTQKVDGFTISLALDPVPIESAKNTQVTVTLTDDKQQPITDTRVGVSLDMTSMSMPPVAARLEQQSAGKYVGKLNPAGMMGTGRITVNVDRAGKSYQTKFNDLTVK